jgi:hypothetical protein
MTQKGTATGKTRGRGLGKLCIYQTWKKYETDCGARCQEVSGFGNH